jgi:hypothetical protein
MNLNGLLDKLKISRRDLPLLSLWMAFPICYGLISFGILLKGDWSVLAFLLLGVPLSAALCFRGFSLIRSSRQKLANEIGRQVIYSETCGGVIGFFSRTFPFVRVAVYDRLLVIKSFEEIQLYPQDIWNLKTFARITASGVQIQHTRKDLPHTIILWRWNSTTLTEKVCRIKSGKNVKSIRGCNNGLYIHRANSISHFRAWFLYRSHILICDCISLA